MTRLNVVVFSKDRPYQLDGLLRTLFDSYKGRSSDVSVTVIYKDSGVSTQVMLGYQKLISLYEMSEHTVNFIVEKDFRQQTLQAAKTTAPYSMMLVDDIVFINPWTVDNIETALEDPKVLCHSLRLHSKIKRCYPINRDTVAPENYETVDDVTMKWSWLEHSDNGDWGYPLSCDGHVFRSKQLTPILEAVPFKNPNTLEAHIAQLASNNASVRGLNKMTCSIGPSALVNIPANRVQHEFPNRAGSMEEVSAETLAKDYVNDKRRITYRPGFVSESVHQEAYDLIN